jgi:adenylate cyclase
MVQQITLHLDVPEAHQQALQRHLLLRGAAQRHVEQLTGIYYDTRRLALRRAGVVLRLRKQGSAWQQTVKHQEVSRGGLSSRPIWDSPYLGRFDFSSVDDAALKDWLNRSKIQMNLTPLFEINVRRTTWKVETASGGVILVKLDRGWVASAGRRQSISEIELRLVNGTVHDLYEIGTSLSQRIPLTPSMVSKVERGYALYLDIKRAPVKAFAVALDADGTTLGAFRLIALNCLAHLHMNHAGAMVGTDPEYVHQMRVATRRLRAALRMFRPVLAPDFIESLVSSLRELMASLGRVRDFDVLMTEIVAPVAKALPEDPRLADLAGVITNRLYIARAEAARLLSHPEYGLLQIEAGKLLHGAPFIDPGAEATKPDMASTAASLRAFAEFRLGRLLKKTVTLAKQAKSDDPSSLHELRISIKRLRYAIEFFGPLIPGKGATRLIKRLAKLQDELGQLNDLASAGAVLMACAGSDPDLREAVALIGGWHGPRHSGLLAAIPDQLSRLSKIALPRIH